MMANAADVLTANTVRCDSSPGSKKFKIKPRKEVFGTDVAFNVQHWNQRCQKVQDLSVSPTCEIKWTLPSRSKKHDDVLVNPKNGTKEDQVSPKVVSSIFVKPFSFLKKKRSQLETSWTKATFCTARMVFLRK